MPKDGPIRVGIAGVRGYKGLEAARIIAGHPRFRVVMVASDAMAGGRLGDLDSDLVRDGDAPALGYTDAVNGAGDYDVDLMLTCTKAERSGRMAPALLNNGVRVLDLSGAHCIRDGESHISAYGFLQVDPECTAEAVYALPEFVDPKRMREARLVANPTSYATLVLLTLRPLAEAGLLGAGAIVDVKGSTSSAGRKARISLLYSELANNCYATTIDRHQHTPEILQELHAAGGSDLRVTVASHILPIARGMLATTYLEAGPEGAEHRADAIRAKLRATFKDSPFVKIKDRAEHVHLRSVIGTNRCTIGVTPEPYGLRVVITSALDNLLKGTAGQAIQNANLMYGLDPTLGLNLAVGSQP